MQPILDEPSKRDARIARAAGDETSARGSAALKQALDDDESFQARASGLQRGVSSLTRRFPMYVMPIGKVSALGRLRPHEEVRTQLVEWTAGMGAVLFLSHTWLGYRDPDPAGEKYALLCELLRKVQSGKLDIHPHWTTETMFGALDIPGAELRDVLKHGYVWLDYWSIPQAADAVERRLLAIGSISSYVADSRYFMVRR